MICSEALDISFLRCVDCNKVLSRHEISDSTMCYNCGGKRFKSVLVLSDHEYDEIKSKGASDEFLALFKPVELPEISSKGVS